MEKLSDIFKTGKVYDVLTKYKEVPVKAPMPLLWVDEEGRLLGFDWKKVTVKKAFSSLEPVYVKVSPSEYAKTQIFSNLGKELVLVLESLVPPPEFINRKSVRVEPDEEKPVKVEIIFNGKRIEGNATDVSETGVGVKLPLEGNNDFVEFVKEKLKSLQEKENLEFDVKVHLPDNGTAQGKGKVRNLLGSGKDLYVRLGFEVEFPRRELDKIRRYVIQRQKEIIQSLRMLG